MRRGVIEQPCGADSLLPLFCGSQGWNSGAIAGMARLSLQPHILRSVTAAEPQGLVL